MAYFRCTGNSGGSLKLRTASGDIASFETNLPEPYQSVTVNAVATQSGSGTPYPPGGGKNKLNYDVWKNVGVMRGTAVWENNGITLTATESDCYTNFAGSQFGDAIIPVSEGETVIISWEETSNKTGIIFIFPNGNTSGMVNANNSTVKSLSYVVGSGVSYVTFRFGVTYVGDTISYKNIQVNKGTQESTWTPYSNICPISGYSSANITRCGVNLADFKDGYSVDANGEIEVFSGRAATVTPIRIDSDKSYVYTSETSVNAVYAVWNGATLVRRVTGFASGGTINTSGGTHFYIAIYAGGGASVATDKPQVIFSTESTEYYAYNGQTYTVNFGQTVYGGVLDVTRGKLHVTFLEFDLGTLTPVMYTITEGNLFRYALDDLKPLTSDYDVTKIICSNYPSVASALRTNKTLSQVSNLFRFDIIDNDYNDAISMKTAMNGVQVVYPLDTPFDIDLTPEVISAVVGTNNVSADCGKTEVKYLKAE